MEEIMTHTGSTVTAKETLFMESGKDIDIKGSKAGGKKVEIKTGNNLSIESLQDSHAYHSRDKESGIHLQRDITARPDTGKKKMDDPYFSIGKKTDTTDSTYISVTKQAGIYAGKEGYDIQVKNNTHLKGAVIDSQAEKEKNRITTGTLTWENIENKAEYKTGGHGISYNGKIGRGDKNDSLDSRINNRYGKDAITGQRNGINKITPTIYGSKIPLNERGLLNTPVPSVKGKAGTTTTSAISKGTITITDKENQKQDIEKLNRNTEDSLNKLKEIFDKTKVEEKQELIHMMNIVGNQIIHEAADHYGWKEGSTEKLLLHGAIGALTGTMSGGNTLSGAVSGSVNEFALAYMEKTKGRDWMDTHPDTVQAISTALGAVAGSLTGDRNTGAYTAQMGTKWNYYEKYPNMKEKIERYLSSDEYKQQEAGTAHVIYLDDSTEHGVIITKDSDTGTGRIIDIDSRRGETFKKLYPRKDGIRPYDKNVTFKRIDKGNDHPTGVYTFGEQDGTVANGHALYPDEIKDWENYRRMKGISMPNYTINKGTLAENMATVAIEYPFALAETMGGNVSTARVLALGPLKTLGMYRTWQEDWKNYSGEDWWKAQGINIFANIPARAEVAGVNALLAYAQFKSPIISAAVGVGTLALTNSWNDSLIQKLKKENLKTDEQKKDEKKEEIK